jgi:hypothetical protein
MLVQVKVKVFFSKKKNITIKKNTPAYSGDKHCKEASDRDKSLTAKNKSQFSLDEKKIEFFNF